MCKFIQEVDSTIIMGKNLHPHAPTSLDKILLNIIAGVFK